MKYLVTSFTSISPVAESGHLYARDNCEPPPGKVGMQVPYLRVGCAAGAIRAWRFGASLWITRSLWCPSLQNPKKNSEVSGFASLGGEAPPYNARGQAVKVILVGASSIYMYWHTYLIDIYSKYISIYIYRVI